MSADEAEPSDDEFESACSALDYFLRGFVMPEKWSDLFAVQSDNYGERTLAVYVLKPTVFQKEFLEACQAWLRMPEWEGWRVLFKCSWKNSDDITTYSDTLFRNQERATIGEVLQQMDSGSSMRKKA